MNFIISYIFRKPDPKYKSIEGLFNHLEEIIGLRVKTKKIILKFAGGSLSTIWNNLRSFKKEKNEVYHITGDIHYMALVTGRNSVLTIHDVHSIIRGSFFRKIYLKLFWFWLPALIVKRITVISHFSKAELEKVIPFAKHKVRVVYNPVNERFNFSQYHFNQTKPRVLLLGTKPNKNLERVLKALNGISCEVVIIGKLTLIQKNLINTYDIECFSKFDLSLDEIIEEYKNCDMMCFASIYEGFGMPIIEAQAIGRPVITSNFGAMKEVAEDSALLVDPFCVEEIKNGILELIENKKLRNNMVDKGLSNVRRFKANEIAEDYIEVYQEINNRA